jgi:hypothetical protein
MLLRCVYDDLVEESDCCLLWSHCYGTSITTALGRIGANVSLIIAILIGYIEGYKKYKEEEEGSRSSAESTPYP